MYDCLRIDCLLLCKNLNVRKRHWIGSIIEFLLPIVIIAITLGVRTSYDVEPEHVADETYYPALTKKDLIEDHIPRSILHVYYRPRNNFTNELMKSVLRCTKLPHNQLLGFDTEDEMLQNYEIQQGKDELISVLAIEFTGTNGVSVPKKLEYKLRSSQKFPDTTFEFDCFNLASDNLIDGIPIVSIQTCLDEAFINRAASDGVTKPTVSIQKMPYPPYDTINPSEKSIQFAMCLFGGVIFLATIYLIPAYVSAEKTSGVNCLLKINGVKSWQNYLSWLITGMLFNTIPIFVVTLLLKSDFGNGQKPFYYHSDCCIIWLALFINVTHVYAFCLHVASYFCRAWLAQLVATTIPVLINIIATQLENTNHFSLVPYLGFFCPTVATIRIFDELNNRENELTGAHWSNIFETAHPTLDYKGSLGFIMISTILGIFCNFFFALYLDAVLPNKSGVSKRPLYFLERLTNYWHPNKVYCDDDSASMQTLKEKPKVLEPVADGAFASGVSIRNLTKCYPSGCSKWLLCCSKLPTFDAVRNLNLDFYKGQITALLGHNGAGKTTTFSILTGLLAPSAGTVCINNKDITKDLEEIRNDVGLCPQENIMFPDLTVIEQLRFVALLKQKNETKAEILHNVDVMLDKLNLSEKRNDMPGKLSGGQKRRVCLGMALIGNASTIFLDEPTSGMDPETSRAVWDLILKYRNQKTIVITTHSMEEADVLGDRIAIMQSGKMKCYATPLYLKKHYGHNYHEVTLSTTSWCKKGKIEDIVGSDAKVNQTHQGRIVINIPFTSPLPEILDKMEEQKAELGITGVSVSLITLEQVFLKAAEEESVDDVDEPEERVTHVYKHLTGSELTRQKIYALLMKKLTYFKNNKDMFLAIMIGALLAVILPGLCFPNNGNDSNSKLLDLNLYQSPEVLINSKNQTLGDMYRAIVEEQGGTGTLTNVEDSMSNELLSRAKRNLAYYKSRIIIAAEFNSSSTANGFYSGSATLSAAITVNTMSNLVLKTVAGNEYSIEASIGDLPRPLSQGAGDKMTKTFHIITGAILFMTIFSHVVALYVKHPLLENSTKMKQLQQMAGVSPFLYWSTMFIVDYVFYNLVTLLTVSVILLNDSLKQTNLIRLTEIGVLLSLFSLFGISALLFAYLHSFIKKQFHLVYSILSGLPLLLTFIVVTMTKVLPWVEHSKNSNLLQRRIFSLQPHVSFLLGYIKFTEIASDNARCRGLSDRLNETACAIGDMCCDMKCSNGNCANPLPYFGNFREEGGLEEYVMYLLFTPIILMGVLYLLEQQWFAVLRSKFLKPKPKSASKNTETDYIVENEKVMAGKAINGYAQKEGYEDENVFIAHGLSKSYGNVEAVKEVSFRVMRNECFGLLGVNGAGKSTTFRMLVGEEVPNSGLLHRGPYSIKTKRTKYLEGIGYCPQTDALIPYFNAEEHLSLFARLRGIPESEVKSEVNLWINKLQLKNHAKNPSGSYSGGNKRRLNIAMALIASPKMVLLDEPTTGVDPAARRSVWTVLQNCQASGQAIILTSHSMEECEALCNRLVIMVQGRLLCVGASQELKERFGAGFNITIKLNPGRSSEDFMKIKEQIQSAFTCELKDEHPGYLFYHITDPVTTWVKMFGTMNALKSKYGCIEDFTVSTSTLEQLFMQFARSSADSTTKSHVSSHLVNAKHQNSNLDIFMMA